MKRVTVVCAALIMLAGCSILPSTLPEPDDQEIKQFYNLYKKEKAKKALGECVLEWYEQSGKAPGMGDLSALAAGLGLGAETGALTGPIAVIAYSAFIRPWTRNNDREKYLKYCMMSKHENKVPSRGRAGALKQR